MGNKVTIYSRKGYCDETISEYNGIKIVPLRTINTKHLEASFHTFWALLHAVFSDADIIHFHAQGPCIFTWIPKLLAPNKKLVFTCHGLDWQRNKWNKAAQAVIKFGELMSARLFDLQVMVSKTLEDYYRKTYGINPVTIYNGTAIHEKFPANIIQEKYGLNSGDYLLFIGRLVPEKAPHRLIKAFKNVKTDKKLVIAGGSSATDEYENYLKYLAQDDDRIIFTSYIYGDELREMYSNAYMYVSASELEGLPLTLLEAMSYDLPCLVSNIPPHLEVLGTKNEYGLIFDLEREFDLEEKLTFALNLPKRKLIQLGENAKELIKTKYSWKIAAKKLEQLYAMSVLF